MDARPFSRFSAALACGVLSAALTTPLSAQAGDLQVFVSTSGVNLDADGYVAALDDLSQSISVNGSVVFAQVSPGSHTATLLDVAENCSVQGANPRTAVVAENGVAELRFEVRCDSGEHAQQVPADARVSSRLPVELGVDVGVAIGIPDDGETSISIGLPAQRFRVGFFASERVSIEPSLGIDFVNVSDVTLTTISFHTGFLYHFSSQRNKPRGYFQIGGGLDYLNLEGFDAIQFSVGGGIGGKFPVGSQFAVRLEADYLRAFENDDVAAGNVILGFLGFSFFTN